MQLENEELTISSDLLCLFSQQSLSEVSRSRYFQMSQERELPQARGPEQSVKDLILALPSELFSHSLSFLPPASIAASSAICRSWRTSVLSNSFLHNEVGLSKMGRGSQPDKVVEHLSRISALARFKLVNVSLDRFNKFLLRLVGESRSVELY